MAGVCAPCECAGVEVAVKAAASEETMDDAMETEIVSVALVTEVWATTS